ncbi:MAG TPA: hypothetical protein VMV68_10050 [Spirochaetia bacterium]|nr:hypothetical protein [Spirochaetia bacterium]
MILLVLGLATALLAACAPAGGGALEPTHTLVIKLLDSYTGSPVAGAQVGFAGFSGTTDSSGACSIDLGTSSGTMTGTLSLHATGYQSLLIDGCSLDASADSQVTFMYEPVAPPTTTHSVTVNIFEMQTNPPNPIEIANGSQALLFVLNRNGGMSSFTTSNYSSSGFVFDTPTFGSDCLISAYVVPGAGLIPFNVLSAGVDLSAAATTLPDSVLTQDTEHTTMVSATRSSNSAVGWLSVVTPYGQVRTLGVSFGGNLTADAVVSNPYGYSVLWSQADELTNSSPSYKITKISTDSIAPLSTSVILPTLSNLGLVGYPDPGTLGYSAGVLSVTPATSAGFYIFTLIDAASRNTVATIVTQSASITLPSWLTSQLSSTTFTVSVSSAVSDVSWDLSGVSNEMNNQNMAAGTQMQIAGSSTTTDIAF